MLVSLLLRAETTNSTGGYYAIASRFDVGVIIAIPAAVLCINRRLYLLASSTSVLPSEADGRREFMIDLVIGIGLPIIEMIFCLSCFIFISIQLIHICSVFCSKRSIPDY